MDKGKQLATVADEDQLALLREHFPTDSSDFIRVSVPRLSFVSQDKTEEVKNKKTGKKEIKVITEGGTFFFERQAKDDKGELIMGEDGKPTWEKEEIGKSVSGIILFQRKQLKMYDESSEIYTNSAVYDNDDEIIPIWAEGKEVGRGTPAELKAKYEYTDKAGKKKSALEDNRILYILIEDVIYQLNLRGSSMYSYMGYKKVARPSIPAVVTELSSEHREKGDIVWEMITFKVERPITKDEATKVIDEVTMIKEGIAARAEQIAQANDNRG